jgi:hypothetical protein
MDQFDLEAVSLLLDLSRHYAKRFIQPALVSIAIGNDSVDVLVQDA